MNIVQITYCIVINFVVQTASHSYLRSAVHRIIEQNATAVYYSFLDDDPDLYNHTLAQFMNFLDPCLTHTREFVIEVKKISCFDDLLSRHNAVSYLKSLCYEDVDNSSSVIQVLTARGACSCRETCEDKIGNYTVLKSPACDCSRNQSFMDASIVVCDFTEHCKWNSPNENRFEPTKANLDSDSNIILGLGKVSAKKPVVYIESAFYQQTSASCQIIFHYYILKAKSSILRVRLIRRNEEEGGDLDYMTLRTIRGYNKDYDGTQLQQAIVYIGHLATATKVRIECLHQGTDDDVTCALHRINMVNCEVHDFQNIQCARSRLTNAFECQAPGHNTCMEDIACDGTPDCPLGDDESGCESDISTGCNFTGIHPCKGWTFELNSATNSSTHFFTISKLIDHHVFQDEHGTNFTEPALLYDSKEGGGPFLVASQARALQMNLTNGRYSFRSPLFPPTSEGSTEKGRGRDQCMLRLRYCQRQNEVDFTISTIEFGSSFDERSIIWRGDGMAQLVPCRWRRISKAIPRQILPFYIDISAIYYKSTIHRSLLAVDDLSLSPSCFHADSTAVIPSKFEFTTCGSSGSRPPAYPECRRDAVSRGMSDVVLTPAGMRMFAAPYTGQYWFHACGASGGFTRGGKGSCVKARVSLTSGMKLHLLIGQRGESPCDTGKRLHGSKACEPGKIQFELGGGGGGATIIYDNTSKIVLIAGGGGGGFHQNSNMNMSAFIDSMAGMGASLVDNGVNCTGICEAATPRNFKSRGSCLKHSSDVILGGYGGGGASCGSGGGGGAGYKGGVGGIFASGSSGSSFFGFHQSDVIYENHSNSNGGFVIIVNCNLSCPAGASCRFISLQTGKSECICRDTLIPPYSGSCSRVPPKDSVGTDDLPTAIVVMICVTIVLAIAAFVAWIANGDKKVARCVRMTQCLGSEAIEEVSYPLVKMPIEPGMILEPDDIERLLINDVSILRQLSNEELISIVPKVQRCTLTLADTIGSGAYGKVHMAHLDLEEGSFDVAAKELNTSYSDESTAKRQFLMEAVLMRLSNVRSDTTIHLVGGIFDQPPFMIVMELMAGGNLLDFLRSCRANDLSLNPKKMTTMHLMGFIYDIVSGCATIEELHYVHRDLAARNCLLTHQGPGMRVKIGDFGLAKGLYSVYRSSMSRDALPVKWLPPEAVEDALYCSKTDVWSFGIVCWEIFSLGRVPYPGETSVSVIDLLRTGYRMEAPVGTPPKMYQMMRACWHIRPHERPTFARLKELVEEVIQDEETGRIPFPSVLDRYPLPIDSPVSPVIVQCMDTPCTVETDIATPTHDEDDAYFDRRSAVPYLTSRSSESSVNTSDEGFGNSGSILSPSTICNEAYMKPDNLMSVFEDSSLLRHTQIPKRPDQLLLPPRPPPP